MEQWPVLHLSDFDPDHENYFHANTFSDHIQRHHLHVLSPHKHHFYVCVCFTKGTGWHEIDFKKHEIQRGSMFVISPGQTHNWQFSEDTEGFVILHSSQFLSQPSSLHSLPFFRVNNPLNALLLEEEELNSILPYFEQALKDYATQKPFFRQTCASYLSLIYHISARFISSDGQNKSASERYNKLYKKFAELIEANFRQHHSIQFYAEKLGVSDRQLNRICSEVSANTAGGTITEKLLLESQTMLADNKSELVEVSESLGFNEYSYFSRWFKKQTGISPVQFRAKYKTISG